MTTWPAALPAMGVLVAVLLVPGLPAAYLVGLRGATAWGAAPALTVTALTVSAAVIATVDLPWSPLVLVVTTLALWVVAALLGWAAQALGPRTALPHTPRGLAALWPEHLAAVTGVLIAAGTTLVVSTRAMVSPDTFLNSPDAVFHLGRLRDFVTTGEVTSLSQPAYPSGFHQLAATLLMLTDGATPGQGSLPSGTDLIAAANLTSIVCAAVVWPLAAVALVRLMLGRRPLVLLTAGALAGAFPAFPTILMGWGVLWPNVLGNALTPVALGLCLVALTGGDERLGLLAALRRRSGVATPDGTARPVAAAAGLLALIGLPFAHPNALVAVGLLTYVALLCAWWRRSRPLLVPGVPERTRRTCRWLLIGTPVLALLALMLVPRLVGGVSVVSAVTWSADESKVWAASEVALGTLAQSGTTWVLTVLGVVGGVVAWRSGARPGSGSASLSGSGSLSRSGPPQLRWAVISWGICLVLYVLDASVGGPVVALLTGYWYNDKMRLAALAVVAALPVVTLGVTTLADGIRAWLPGPSTGPWSGPSSGRGAGGTITRIAAAVLVLGLVAGCSGWFYLDTRTSILAGFYQPTTTQAVIATAEDRADLQAVADAIPAGQSVAVDPATGGSLLYALDGREVLFRNMLIEHDPGRELVGEHLHDVTTNPAVCDELRRLDMRWALDADPRYWVGDATRTNGLHNLALADGLTLVGTVGRYSLYRIDACGFGQS